MTAPGGPLNGLTVISLEQAVAAPLATRHLADLGARVIKLERPGDGDFARGYDTRVKGEASYFVWLNRSKQSVTVDIKTPEGHEVVSALLRRADVFVHNLGPGAARRLGLDADTLMTEHPNLVVCTISGYGVDGPWADRKAYDLLIQAEVGLVSITGSHDSPAKVGISVADISAGMYAYSGILAALLHRNQTGQAIRVDVSLMEALSEWMSQPALYARYGGSEPERLGAQHATIAPYGPYRAGDGTEVMLAIQNDREWARLCRLVLQDTSLIDDPDFASGSDRVRNRTRLNEIVGKAVRRWTRSQVVERLRQADVAYAGLNSVSDLFDHPALAGRNRIGQVALPDGTVVMALRPPVDLGEFEVEMDKVPGLGEHTVEVLRELGHTDDEVARMRQGGVI